MTCTEEQAMRRLISPICKHAVLSSYRLQRLLEAGIVDKIKYDSLNIDVSKCSKVSYVTQQVSLKVYTFLLSLLCKANMFHQTKIKKEKF